MDGKQTVWVVVGATSILTGYRALTTGFDPIPQLAGIGASGVILLFLAEPAPKFAASLAVLMGLTLVLNWETADRISGGGRRRNSDSKTDTEPVTGPR
jgi:hypothetical protein